MKVSVIIPTYNAQSLLPDLLERLASQTVSHELIIIDSSSSDTTRDIAKRYTDRILTIPKEEFDHGGTRTKAAKMAYGEIIVFLTQDALPTENTTLEKLIGTFKNLDISASFGRQLPYENTSLFGKHLRYFNYPETSYVRTFADAQTFGIKTAFFSDSFSAYRKEVLQNVGWFKNGLIVGEDMHIAARILQSGGKLAYCAEATVYHSHSYTLAQECKRYFDTGVFHTSEAWLIDIFGKAEGEGGRYIRSELHYLFKQRAYSKIPEFFLRNTMKLIGYKLGKQFRSLPSGMIRQCSMHPEWWNRYHSDK